MDAQSGTSRYIVRLEAEVAGAAAAVAGVVSGAGGRVVGTQARLGTMVVEVDSSTAASLVGVAGVEVVSPDRSMKATSLGFTPSSQPGAMTNITRITGANAAWTSGVTGDGVDVAMIDTGVAPVGSLSNATKVVVGPDLSFESQDADLRYLDTYGHGTHMGGIISGREVAKGSGSAYAADTSNFYGMAPDSRLVSIKVADNQGAVDVSQVIAAIDWVVQYKTSSGMNIRVLNLSYGSESPQSPQQDPLSWAAEVAWKSGIVVVASAGNEGGTVAGLNNPAYNPWVIAVGSTDTKGTDVKTDDIVASFSAKQGGNFGNRSVDVVAPGVGIVAPGVTNSNLYNTYPAARVGNGFLRGSGTSQSAAVVSGAAALLLQHRSWLNPDQVKSLLMSTATPLTGTPVTAQGSGQINIAGAMAAYVGTTQSQTNGTGTGSIESARGGFHVSLDGYALQGEYDIMGRQWDSNVMATAASNKTAWSADGTFNGGPWAGAGFATDTTSWAGRTWQGRTWQGRTWQGAWSGRTWQGRTWQNITWTGSSWSSASWKSVVVGGSTWAGELWSSKTWK